MAIKVTRTYGMQVLMEKCGCKVQRDYSDPALKTPLEQEATYTPCAKHKTKKDAAETIELILGEMLEKEAADAAKTPVASAGLGHSVADVALANQAGAQAAVRTPINVKKPGAPTSANARGGVRRAAGNTSAGPVISTAVAEARAAGNPSSLDAELARAPEPQGGVRLGPISRNKVAEIADEVADDGQPVTALDVILGANDPTGGGV